jgi:hypothetical protein
VSLERGPATGHRPLWRQFTPPAMSKRPRSDRLGHSGAHPAALEEASLRSERYPAIEVPAPRAAAMTAQSAFDSGPQVHQPHVTGKFVAWDHLIRLLQHGSRVTRRGTRAAFEISFHDHFRKIQNSHDELAKLDVRAHLATLLARRRAPAPGAVERA